MTQFPWRRCNANAISNITVTMPIAPPAVAVMVEMAAAGSGALHCPVRVFQAIQAALPAVEASDNCRVYQELLPAARRRMREVANSPT